MNLRELASPQRSIARGDERQTSGSAAKAIAELPRALKHAGWKPRFFV